MDKLIKYISKTNDLDKMVKEIAKYFESPIMLLSSNYHLVSYYMFPEFQDDVFLSALSRKEMTYEFVSKLEETKDFCYMSLSATPYKRRISKLFCDDVIVGYLVLVDYHQNLLSFVQNDFEIIEGLLAKQLLFSFSKGNLFSSNIKHFLTTLLNESFIDDRVLDYKSSYVFQNKIIPNALAVIDIKGYESSDFFNDTLKIVIDNAIPGSHSIVYNGNIVVFYTGDNHKCFDKVASKFNLQVMCSKNNLSLQSFKPHYQTCLKALAIAKKFIGSSFVEHVDKFSYLLLLDSLSNDKLHLDESIIKIKNADCVFHTNNLELIYLYLKNNKSLQKTCEALYIHRNTVLYRLSKLKEEFSLDLDNDDKRAEYLITVAVMLYQMNHYKFFLL